MSELRWTLLILGVVFIAALSWWERRRPRQAFAPRLRDSSPGRVSPEPPEPWIGETEISDAVLSDVALNDAADTPEADDEEAMRAHVDPSVGGPLGELPTLIIPDRQEQVQLQAAWDEAPPEPTLVDPEEIPPVEAPVAAAAKVPVRPREIEIREVETDEIPGAEGVGTVRIVERFPAPAPAAAPKRPVSEPIVEWPPEESRRIVSLRLVASHPERFAGRTLRLAMAAEGFILGKFSIFHKPDESNRAVLSAASLTRPGAFDLETMDLQRYAGLSLFAVLPGPKTPLQAFEELLATARNLNERLQGALQDDRGGPLTVLRIASIRESLRAETDNSHAPSAHET
ncbi:MAG TPA: cell division protein ZipA C-terminal FtsZ-binding domain-containing protein [Steroidobacteraceae bacterium]|nr:cell division protein ZipA C-terminal FtsZ-binding domain-containing protein [Steroidobacteraceae bacterium]